MKLLKNIANFTNLKIPEIWAQLFPMQIDFDHGDSGIEVLCLIYHTPKS